MFGDILQELRADAGLTQEDLAIKFNVTRTAISRYETGENEPNINFLISCAEFFNVSIDYLLGVSRVQTPHLILKKLDKLDKITYEDSKKLNSIFHAINNNVRYIDLFHSILEATDRFNSK